MTEVVEGEVVGETGQELEHYAAPAPATLFRSDEPTEIVARATETANALRAVVQKQKLTVTISGREHCRVEAWTLLGTLLGVFPVCVWTRKLEDGWEARVEARTKDGAVVGAAEAECLRSENTWKSRDDYALRSMAQTRATSKALRQPLGFVMTLAGFEATPAEEMPAEDSKPQPDRKLQKMRADILELARQADEKREDGKETLGEVTAALKEIGASSLDDADETALAVVGSDLGLWVTQGCNGEFKPVPF